MTRSPIRRALLGAVWLSATGYLTFLLNFGLNLLLARLLFPKDFGQFALAGSLAEILSIATGFSFSQGIIQMQDAPGIVETAYVLSLRLYGALFLGGITLAAALRPHYPGPFIPLFVGLFAVRNLSVISYVFSATLERTFHYNQISRVRLASVILSVVAALALARAGAGVWSLLGRELVLSATTLIGFRVLSGWRYRGGYNLETARALWRFGWQMFVSRALEIIWYRGDTALLGILAGTLTLGFYDRGRYLAEFGHYVVSFAAVQVAFPVYARLAGRREALTYTYRQSHGLLVRFMLPALIWLALFPREIVGLLYGAGVRWDETAAILPWLAAFGFVFPVVENIKVLLIGIGRVRDATLLRFVQAAVALPLLIPAIRLAGPYGAGTVMFVSEVAGLAVGYRALRREVTGLYLGTYVRPAAAALVAGGGVAALRAMHLLPWVGRSGYAANLAAVAGVYLVCLFLIDRQQLQEHIWAVLSGLRGEVPAELTALRNGADTPVAATPLRDSQSPPLAAAGGRAVKVTVSVGGTFHAFRLAEQLDARGMLHRLVTTHRPRRGEQIPAERIVANAWPEALMRGPRLIGLRWQAGDYLKAVAFDRWAAEHTDGCDVWVGFAAFSLMAQRAARARGACTVLERGSTHILTQHSLVAEEYRRWKCPVPPLDQRLVGRQLREYEETEYISVPSRFAYQSFLDRGFDPERLLLIPYGADCRLFSPGTPPPPPFRIVAVGVSLRKGTPYLLDACARLGIGASHGPEMELWLAGAAAPDVSHVLRTTSVPVRHLGALSHRELAAVYRSASVFVLPSIEEGMALSALEAMASGLPVIVTPNTGATDVMVAGRDGLVVPPRDAGALAQAILSLYEDEPRRRAMAEAAARTAQRWTWEAYGDRAAAAYASLVTRSGVSLIGSGG